MENDIKKEVEELRQCLSGLENMIQLTLEKVHNLEVVITHKINLCYAESTNSGDDVVAVPNITDRNELLSEENDVPQLKRPRIMNESITNSFLLKIPDTVLLQIFNMLDISTLCTLSLTCSNLRNMADTMPWKQVYQLKIGRPSLLIGREDSRKGRGGRFWKDHVWTSKEEQHRWELGGVQHTLAGHNKAVKGMQFRGNKLLTNDESVIKEWALDTLQLAGSFSIPDQRCMCFAFDGQRLAVSCTDAVRVYEANTKELLFSLGDILSPIMCMVLDSERLVTGTWDGFIKLWSVHNGELQSKLTGHNRPIYCLDYDGGHAVSGSSDKLAKLWDLNQGVHTVTLRGHTKTILTVKYHAPSNTVLTGSRDCHLKMWDARIGQCVASMQGHTGPVTCLQFDATKVVSGSDDCLIKVWDMRTASWMYNFSGHTSGITSLQFNSLIMITTSLDKNIKIWQFI